MSKKILNSKYIQRGRGPEENTAYGDVFDARFKDYKIIPNVGHQNCGILINPSDPTRIIKCENKTNYIVERKHELDLLKKIDIYHIFPKIYDITEFNGKTFIEMERFDGDLSYLLLKVCSKKVCNEMQIDIELCDLFIRLLLIQHQYSPSQIEDINTLIKDLNTYIVNPDPKQNHYFESYKKFLVKLQEEWKIIIPILINEIIKLEFGLFVNDLFYYDFKLDNFGYKLTDEPLDDDPRTIMIFDKYLYVYILDWESGLTHPAPYNRITLREEIFDKEKIRYLFRRINELGCTCNVDGKFEQINVYALGAEFANAIKDEHKDILFGEKRKQVWNNSVLSHLKYFYSLTFSFNGYQLNDIKINGFKYEMESKEIKVEDIKNQVIDIIQYQYTFNIDIHSVRKTFGTLDEFREYYASLPI